MKLLTASDLQSALDDDVVWRRREVSVLVQLMRGSASSDRNVLIRASIPILYAHWEGFGRNCILKYLDLVSYKRIKFKNLKPSFLYLSSIGLIQQIDRAPYKTAISLFSSISSRAEKTNKENHRKYISTGGNLRHHILTDLILLCGLDEECFQDDEEFINRELCDSRNEIAHGVGGAPPLEVFIDRRDKTFALMSKLQALVVNAAIAEDYRSIAA